jgi:hypothetical protein
MPSWTDPRGLVVRHQRDARPRDTRSWTQTIGASTESPEKATFKDVGCPSSLQCTADLQVFSRVLLLLNFVNFDTG